MGRKHTKKIAFTLAAVLLLLVVLVIRPAVIKGRVRQIATRYVQESYDFSFEADTPVYYALSNFYKVNMSITDSNVLDAFTVTVKNGKVACDDLVARYHIQCFAGQLDALAKEIWGDKTGVYIRLDSPNWVRVPLAYSMDSAKEELFSDENVFLYRSFGLILPSPIESDELSRKIWDTCCGIRELGYGDFTFFLWVKQDGGEYASCEIEMSLAESRDSIGALIIDALIKEMTVTPDHLLQILENADYANAEAISLD